MIPQPLSTQALTATVLLLIIFLIITKTKYLLTMQILFFFFLTIIVVCESLQMDFDIFFLLSCSGVDGNTCSS